MIWNLIKTGILFAVLTVILLATSFALGVSPLIAIGFAALLNLGVYWFSDRIVLAMTRAKKVTEVERPELHAIVNRLASNAGVPTPSIAVVESPVPNAFATGRSPSHATVAVHSSLLNALDRDELEGVLAHEMTHIKNYDTLTSVVVGTVAGAISYLAHRLVHHTSIRLWGTTNPRFWNRRDPSHLPCARCSPSGAIGHHSNARIRSRRRRCKAF